MGAMGVDWEGGYKNIYLHVKEKDGGGSCM